MGVIAVSPPTLQANDVDSDSLGRYSPRVFFYGGPPMMDGVNRGPIES